MLKIETTISKEKSFGTSTSWEVFSEMSSSVILLTLYESYVLKTGMPILWMSLEQKRCPQGKLMSNICFSLSSHADSLSEGYIPVSMPYAIFTVFSLLIYMFVSISLNPFAFSKEENVMITGCVGVIQAFGVCNHIGLSSSPPLISEGMNSPSVESPCLTAAIC